MSELSPASQAVLNAAGRQYAIDGDLQDSIAAALRAVVQQVRTDKNLRRHYAAVLSEMRVIDDILAIAAELESQ